LVDPFSLPELSEHGRRSEDKLRPSQSTLEELSEVLIHVTGALLTDGTEKRCNLPLAVVLGKADALPVDEFDFLRDLYADDGYMWDDARQRQYSQRCRDVLVELDQEPWIQNLEGAFSHVQYFACSALGRMPDPQDSSPFRPAGVMAPLLWLGGDGIERFRNRLVSSQQDIK
jgi:hypothetical protein